MTHRRGQRLWAGENQGEASYLDGALARAEQFGRGSVAVSVPF